MEQETTCPRCGLPITELMQHLACIAATKAEEACKIDTKDISFKPL